MKKKTAQIVLLILSALLFGISLYVLIGVTNGALEFRDGWPWLLFGLPTGGTGIVYISRDLKD